MSSADAIQDASILADAHEKPCVSVPIVRATSESLIGYGTLVSDFHAEDIIRVTWPKLKGWRPILPGTGNLQVTVGNSRIDRLTVLHCCIALLRITPIYLAGSGL